MQFILEFDKDFSLIGTEHRRQVGGQDFYIDLLFYTEGSTPKVFKMSDVDQRYIKEQFSKQDSESRIRLCKGMIYK